MNSGLRIGRIFSIRIVADWSWALFLLIITAGLGGVLLPALYPQWDFAFTWGTALAGSLLFFASVLAHEFAHSLAARASHIATRETVLFPFGGVPNTTRGTTTPLDEMVTAVVGPMSSLLLGAVLLLLGLVRAGGLVQLVGDRTALAVGGDLLALLLLWLGAINLLLGALNLIPGYPLDGGRVLRSVLWEATRNWSSATEWASRAGQITAWSLVAAGIWIGVSVRVPFAAVGFVGGLLLCFLGWILNRAISQTDQRVPVRDTLAMVPVARFMSPRVPTVPPNIPLSSLMEDYAIGSNDTAFPVVDNEHLVGLICTQDVCKVPREKWDTTEVGEVMTSAGRVAIARPDHASSEVVKRPSQAREMAADMASYSVGHENR